MRSRTLARLSLEPVMTAIRGAALAGIPISPTSVSGPVRVTSAVVCQLPLLTVSTALSPSISAVSVKLPSASVQPQPAAASVSPGVAQSASMDSSAGTEPVTATAAPTSGSLPLGSSTRPLTSMVFVSASALPAPKAASSSTAVRVKAGSPNSFYILRWSFLRCVAGRPEPAVRGSAAGHARIDHVAQAVTEQVQRQHHDEDHDAGHDGHPRGDPQELPAVRKHDAPLRQRRLGSEP